jgi:hypothetical protein
MPEMLPKERFEAMTAYRPTAGYLSVGPICFLDNPLQKPPLTLEPVKPSRKSNPKSLDMLHKCHCNEKTFEENADHGAYPNLIRLGKLVLNSENFYPDQMSRKGG